MFNQTKRLREVAECLECDLIKCFEKDPRMLGICRGLRSFNGRSVVVVGYGRTYPPLLIDLSSGAFGLLVIRRANGRFLATLRERARGRMPFIGGQTGRLILEGLVGYSQTTMLQVAEGVRCTKIRLAVMQALEASVAS